MQSNNIIKITLTDEEAAYLKSQPRGYLRTLLQNDMGGEDGFSSLEEAMESQPKYTRVEKVVGDKKIHIPVLDKPTCKACGCYLDTMGRCSQKRCKLFLKVQ